MAKPAFAETLKQTQRELDRLRRERAQLDTEIFKLEQVESALQGLTEPDQNEAADLSSITNVVRMVLKSAREPITPPQVRDKMIEMGFDKGPYSQFLASVHVILKRLSKKNEVFEFTFRDTKTYWWVRKSMPMGPLPENAMLGNYYNSRRPGDLKTSLSYSESEARERAKYSR